MKIVILSGITIFGWDSCIVLSKQSEKTALSENSIKINVAIYSLHVAEKPPTMTLKIRITQRHRISYRKVCFGMGVNLHPRVVDACTQVADHLFVFAYLMLSLSEDRM